MFVSAGFLALWRARHLAIEVLILAIVLLVHALAAIVISWGGGIEITSGSASRFYITQEQTLEAGLVLLGASSFVLGVSLLLAPIVRNPPSRENGLSNAVVTLFSPTATRWFIVGGVVFAAVLWLANGAEQLQRTTYQFLEPGSAGAALTYLTLPVALVLAFCAYLTRGWWRFLSLVGLLALALAELSGASRGFSVIVTASLGMGALFARRVWARLAILILTALVALGTLSLVIQLRAVGSGQGLLPYAQYAIAGNLVFGSVEWEMVMNNLLLSIPVTLASSHLELPPGFLAISMSPLSGEAAGFYSIYQTLSLGYQTPSNAIGQLMAEDTLTRVFGWLLLVTLLTLPSLLRRRMTELPLLLAQISGGILALAAVLQFLQYSLRSGMRFVWASIALSMTLWAVSMIVSQYRTRYRTARAEHHIHSRAN